MQGKHSRKSVSMLPSLWMDPMSIASVFTLDNVTGEGITLRGPYVPMEFDDCNTKKKGKDEKINYQK
jgi:hypothetical protein